MRHARAGPGVRHWLLFVLLLRPSVVEAQANEFEPEPASTDVANLEGDAPVPAADLPTEPTIPPLPEDSGLSPPEDVPPLPDVGEPDRPVKSSPTLPGPSRSKRVRSARSEVPPAVPLVTEADLETHLVGRAEALRQGDVSRAELALDLLEETRGTLAVQNVVVASALLVHEAQSALAASDGDRAVRLAEASARLSPDLPAAHWMRIRAYASHDASGAGRMIAGVRDFVAAWLRGFRNQAYLIVQVSLLTILALLAAAALYAVVQASKYLAFLGHDLASYGPRFVGAGEVLIVLLATIILPLIVLASVPLSVAVALAMLMAYQTRGERLVSVGLLAVLAAVPLVLRLVAPMATLDGTPVDTLAMAASEASVRVAGGRNTSVRSNEEGARPSYDFAGAVVRAHRLRRMGDLEGAEKAYRKALDGRPGQTDALNNLGVVQYLLGRRDAARTAFKASQSGGRAEPILNLAIMNAEDGRFEDANRLLERAKGIDSEVVARYQALDSALTAGQKLAETRLDEGLLWRELLSSPWQSRAGVAGELGRTTLGPASGLGLTLALLVLGAIGYGFSRLKDRVSAGCPKCGRPAAPDPNRPLCDQCRSVFLSAVAVDPELRLSKERQVRRHQRWRRWFERVLALVAGGGDAFGGRPWAGVMMLFVFCFALGVALVPHGWGVHGWDVFMGDTLDRTRLVMGLGLAGLLSVWSVGRTLAR